MNPEERGVDIATDGDGWQWGIATILTVVMLAVAVPVMAAVAAADRILRWGRKR